MKKLKLNTQKKELTFAEGCKMYLQDCKARNLRQGTINHYRQSITQFEKYFDSELPISNFTEGFYNDFVIQLTDRISNDVSVNSYLRDYITIIHFFQREGFIPTYRMKGIKVDKHPKETYTEAELAKLLRKPDMRECSFTEYSAWVMSCFLFSTGVRQRTLNNIKIKDLDFESNTIVCTVTKNRKVLIIPMDSNLKSILLEYLEHRQAANNEEYLFCNVFGKQLNKSTGYHMLFEYNKKRGVEKTGIHRYRHTFARQWILNGGNAAVLSKLLGHSSLEITQNYINLLTQDLQKDVDDINLLSKFLSKKFIQM